MNLLPIESILFKPWGKINWEENKNKSGYKKSDAVFLPMHTLNKCMDYILTWKMTYHKNCFNIYFYFH